MNERQGVKGIQMLRATSWCALIWVGSALFHLSEASESKLEPARPVAAAVAPSQDAGPSLAYTIGPGDLIHILVWKEPDFSGEFAVRFDGRITLPLLGDVLAAGKTPPKLSAELEQELRRFIEVPQVTTTIAQALSARYFVIGKVNSQGAFPYIGPIRAVQALALAGGFQEFASLSRIFIIREVNGTLTYLPVDYQQIESNRNLGPNIQLLSGDTIVVP